ncbi:MAG: SDR family NAD(P)-dependent oxidoreductase [Chloroflexi bacterium]|nr:SDR family NAD(P)-dependent oxidoreductase [Chloroflexota bacterium]
MQNILITGANRGIGLALTQQLLANGDRVIATCRQPRHAGDLTRLNDQFPERLTILPLDVTNAASVQAAGNAVQRIVSCLDLLINNAGILDRRETLATFDPVVMQHTFDVNATGALRVAAQFLPLLRGAEQGKLVNISSQLGSLQKMKAGSGTLQLQQQQGCPKHDHAHVGFRPGSRGYHCHLPASRLGANRYGRL